VAPSSEAYLPDTQTEHVDIPSKAELVPTSHISQIELPNSLAKYPDEQFWHWLCPEKN
jgi:hypothetical protein